MRSKSLIDCKFIFIVYDVVAEGVLILFFFEQFKAPLANLALIKGAFILQILLEVRQDGKDILLFISYLPLTVLFNQFLHFFLYDCEFERKVVFTSQDLYYLAKSQTSSQNGVVSQYVLLRLWKCTNVADFGCLCYALYLLGAGGQILEEDLYSGGIKHYEGIDFVCVYHFEESGEEHRVDSKLLTMDGTFDSFNYLLVVTLAGYSLMYFMGIALPFQFLAFLDDGLDVLSVDAADQRLDLIRMRDDFLIFVVILVVVIAEVSEFFDLLDELRLVVQFGLPLVEVELLEHFQEVHVEVEVALVSAGRVVLQNLLLELHPSLNSIQFTIMSMLSPRFQLDKKRTRTRTMFALPPEKWYDVQDEDGVWRVGYCEKTQQQYKIISLDGFHPSHTAYYCEHAAKIAPVRTHTRGLTVPQVGKTLRRIITLKQVQSVMGKLNLYQLKSNQFENTCEGIRGFLRTELFITVDKIFNTPFEILGTIKLIDIHINKFFINVIEYYLKLLESSKKFLIVLDSNQMAIQIYNATYQMTLLIEMILGVHKRSKAFYESSLNRTVTPEGFLDCFIKSQAGIIPFKLFFKSASSLKSLGDNDMTICMEVICLFVSMCQKYQKQFVEGSKYQATTRIIVEEIINLVKSFCEKNQSLRAKCKQRMEIISRIETLYLKLFPNKPCLIRKIIDGDIEQEKQSLKDKFLVQLQAEKKSKLQEKDNEKMKELQAKINTLQTTISKLQTISIHNQNISVVNQKEQMDIPNQPTDNLGEQAFLGSLDWALDSGDINTCKKLIAWRRSLLKLGRITGWEIALAVGMKTFKKKEITSDDIIEANYNFLLKEAARSK